MTDPLDRLPRPIRTLVAGIGGYLLSAALRQVLLGVAGLDAPYQPFYLGIIAAAFVAGTPAGLLTAGLAAVTLGVEIRQDFALQLETPADQLRLALFVFIAVAISILAGRLQWAQGRALARGNRLSRLREYVGAMAAASTPPDVAEVMIGAARRSAGAVSGGILLNDRGAGGLVTITPADDVDVEGAYPGRVWPVDAPMPAVATFRDGVTRWFLSRAEVEAAFPQMSSLRRHSGAAALAAFPLEVDGRRFGAAWLSFPDGHPADAGDRAFLAALAGHAAQALERARLFEAEHEARVRAEAAELAAATSLITLAAAVAVVPDPLFVMDQHDDVVLRNPAAEALFEDPPRTFGEIIERLRLATGGGAATQDLDRSEPLRLAGTGRWLEPQLSPASTPGARVLVLRDVSQVRDMRAAHDAFLGVLSHELRTPVTTIYGNAQLLVRPHTVEQMTDLANDVQVEAERLKRLVDDLLVLSRVERERLEIGEEPVLIQRVVPAVVSAEQRRLPGTRFMVRISEGLPPVIGDATYIEQIVRNLLSNAAKYGPPDGLVSVIGETDGRVVTVRVTDQGGGFSDAESERLFELFYRSAKHAATAPGAGIGLFVTRQLVTTMGGRIWARPLAEGGAEFGFELRAIDEHLVDIPEANRAAASGVDAAGVGG